MRTLACRAGEQGIEGMQNVCGTWLLEIRAGLRCVAGGWGEADGGGVEGEELT